MIALFSRWRAARRRDRAVRAQLDALFRQPEVLAQGRLRPRHRHRLNVLEADVADDGTVFRLLLGIIRHPKAHPLAPRGDEVLELLEYLPNERLLRNVGARNLTRRPV